ncbi:2-amino-4-hydroxy-6-hydroxymethyldihydropteridine diphosphokinase [Ammoniphilus sp. CFH 90114]|uniref:2-amino-4-hydroxy-6- hydroxymethyldihydropteridine diphosphokinase n=1 Tax=Ammoniphilus sp. CFH 90114 TaxID=2493665 RepID=UPI00100FBD92|nr:2-amino-4-hydroxy-6-hydroxymethyldihydropteridine diphosphokinase [Ammoniphilus sp. CFH 90114]RXT09031.1 2-amino-4-hydroxy-6-hydroxymethyldihydropteridine diphosphokinase [Ammoniphilus sp. CFH 90114]
MVPFYLSLGSNLGDRLNYLSKAILALKKQSSVILESYSSIYETDPVGYTDQPAFLNMVVGGKTGLSPHELLHMILDLERQLGRKRDIRYGPRTIDLDILVFGTAKLKEEELEVPHPRMADRAFVMIPLAEIAPDFPIPILSNEKTTPVELLEKVTDKSGVRKWKNIDWATEFELFEN